MKSTVMGAPSWSTQLLASLVVFLIALPLCMGIALASGLPPEAGLISGMIAGVVIGSLAGCPLQVSGPAAGLVAVVWETVQTFGIPGLGIAVLLAGLMQVLVGQLGLAVWFRAMSPAVIQGGLSGLGALIAASQFHVMLDTQPESSGLGNLLKIPETVYLGIFPIDGTTHHLAALTGLIAIGVMILWTFTAHRFKGIPAPLIAVLVAVLIAQLFQFPIRYIEIPDNIFQSLHFPTPDGLGLLLNPGIWVSAFTIAFVATIETVLTMVAIERLKPDEKSDFNQELKAQGLGNAICGLLGVLPVAGVIIRSAANINAGATTRYPAILHGVWMLLPALLFPVVLESIPVAVLAALLVFTGCRLINLSAVSSLKVYGRFEVAIFAATMLSTIVFNLLTGVMVGVILSVVKLVYHFSSLEIQEITYPFEKRLVLTGSATFVRLPKLITILEAVPPTHSLILDLNALLYIDHACLEYLLTWEKQFLQKGGQVMISKAEMSTNRAVSSLSVGSQT